MRAFKIMFFLVFVLWFPVSMGFATPSTHIWSPSTDVQPYKKWHLTSDFYVPTENNADNSRTATVTNFGLTAGILPFEKLNAEIGFDHKSGYGTLDDFPWYFNTKVGIPENTYGRFFPALAVGIYDVGTKADKTSYNVVYGKAAKTFYIGDFCSGERFFPAKGLCLGRFSAGYFRGDSDLLLHGTKKDNSGVLLAWERTITEISDKLWVAVDYQGSQSSYGSTNIGFSYKFSDNTSVIFGYDFYNNKDLADTYTVQVDIDF